MSSGNSSPERTTLTIPNPLVIIHDVILPSREGNRSGCNFAEGGILTMPFTSNLSNCAGVCPFNSQWNADCGKNDQHSTPASAKSCTHVEGTGYSRVSIQNPY